MTNAMASGQSNALTENWIDNLGMNATFGVSRESGGRPPEPKRGSCCWTSVRIRTCTARRKAVTALFR
jgi:hypothetical protein